MEKFKAKHPSNADFEEKLAKYAKLADDVWRQVSPYQSATESCFKLRPSSLHTVLAKDFNLPNAELLLCNKHFACNAFAVQAKEAYSTPFPLQQCIMPVLILHCMLQSTSFDLEFVHINCQSLAASVRDEALGWVQALSQCMQELDLQTLQVSLADTSTTKLHMFQMTAACALWADVLQSCSQISGQISVGT